MSYTCESGGGEKHHHSFGGTYPCQYPEPCEECTGAREAREARLALEHAIPHDGRRETR